MAFSLDPAAIVGWVIPRLFRVVGRFRAWLGYRSPFVRLVRSPGSGSGIRVGRAAGRVLTWSGLVRPRWRAARMLRRAGSASGVHCACRRAGAG